MKLSSSIFRRLQSSHRPWSTEVEAEGKKQARVCAHNNLLICLPDDVLFKILLSLSAEDIHRASLVSRRLYYETTRSEEFVNLHLQQQTDEYGLFFRYAATYNYQHPSQRAVFVSMKQGRVTVSNYYAYKFRYMLETSCNGLILEYEPLLQLHVVNPVTGRPFQLPPLPKNAECISCCVGYADASSKAYKVVLAYRTDRESDVCQAILTLGVDKSWRHLETDQYLTESTLSRLMVTEGFIHLIFGDTVLTLNVETEVMMETRAPIFSKNPSKFTSWWYLSTGKSLTLVVEVEHQVFQVWEMVRGDYNCYWREWERQIELRSEIQYLRSIEPVGWLQQMEVLVLKVSSRNKFCLIYYVVIATGKIGWIDPTSSNKEWLAGELYMILDEVFPHKNTFVNPFTI
ncbi:Unknown protein [Striga hermonthica]|uniref:F-box domain-containing protein n=1 Tax=Striga hermonthica TaxID=68872 RepID=A0A9N7R259_STRHE|nr:Unknown protein [Striga hermonthica]